VKLYWMVSSSSRALKCMCLSYWSRFVKSEYKAGKIHLAHFGNLTLMQSSSASPGNLALHKSVPGMWQSETDSQVQWLPLVFHWTYPVNAHSDVIKLVGIERQLVP
jgi:hypothetical protein